MSRACIITSTNRSGSCASTSVMVHCRNALVLSRSLNIDLIEGESDAHKLEQDYDHIICNYASFYMPWRAYFPYLMESKARLWWMVNDHDVEDNVLLRNILKATGCKRTYGVISNNSREGFRQWILRKWIEKGETRLNQCIDEWHTINLNALTYENLTETKEEGNELFEENYPAIYWGSWRKWRLPYFLKYSHPEIYFSTSKKNKVKLETNGCKYQYLPPLSWGSNATLLRSNATVYLEDPHTHSNFAFPANRFYEAISCGVDVYFDETCRRNADMFGYRGLKFIDSPEELAGMANRKTQDQSEWRKSAALEKEYVISQVASILSI